MVKRGVYIEVGRYKGVRKIAETPVLYIKSKKEVSRLLKRVKQKLREIV